MLHGHLGHSVLALAAAAEIEIYGQMARRRPLGLRDWAEVPMEIRAAQLASSYFWFLSGEPERGGQWT